MKQTFGTGDMTILVTGGAGYIGSHMVLSLVDAGERVIVLDDLSTGFVWAVPKGVELVVGDTGDAGLVSGLLQKHKIEAVVHFAAKIVVPDSVSDPLGYYHNNTSNARTLIECAVKQGVKHFIFSSTAAVYGEPQQNPVTDTETLKPINPYGRSKLMVEWMLQDTAKAHDLTFAILRYFNVAGADPQMRSGQSSKEATHLIKVAVQTALRMRSGMEVFGTDYETHDGSCVRDYIQVSDLAQAHMDALAYLRKGGDSVTCNCGYQRGFSVLEVIEVVKKVSGVDFPVTISGRRPGDPAAIVASNSTIKSVLNWQPRYDDLELIVRQALDWESRLQTRAK
jgi:UDP-glucose 4-epimerase